MLPNCAGLASTCGPGNNESCCASGPVPGGTYNRSNDVKSPATVSDFRLDRFEITVGRFRAFVSAYPGSKPAAGAGAHPLIAASGWDATWDKNLPADKASLMADVKCDANYQTWTDDAGANENVPMTCIDWYEAFAFCAWDGGRLPTHAEWNYASAGGSEQRLYPWGNAFPDPLHAVYDCTGDGSAAGNCAFTDILKVGSKPAGDGKWGQADLAGGVFEWNLDWFTFSYPNPCNDCANLQTGSARALRGGSWDYSAQDLFSGYTTGVGPSGRINSIGARCARSP
jgi:formylglycine-generating enzyme